MSAVMVPAAKIDLVWEEVSGMLAAALEHSAGEYRLSDVRALLDSERWQLWSDGRSVCVTSVIDYPAKRILFVHVASGELSGVSAMWPKLQDFATQNRCGAVQFFGRPGWRRSGVLPEGFRHSHDVLTVEV